MGNIVVEKVWLTDTAVWIRTTDGKEACEQFAEYPRLKFATPEQVRPARIFQSPIAIRKCPK